MAHPFGNLLAQHRARKPGLTQAKLAELIGYDPAVVGKMCRGGRELTGPSGRMRVVHIIDALRSQGALATLNEANALLAAAGMPPLFADEPVEAALMQHLGAAYRLRASVPGFWKSLRQLAQPYHQGQSTVTCRRG